MRRKNTEHIVTLNSALMPARWDSGAAFLLLVLCMAGTSLEPQSTSEHSHPLTV